MRIDQPQPPFPGTPAAAWNERSLWPAWWVDCVEAGEPPFVTLYRLKATFDAPARLRFHVSADERYILFLDDARIGRGPERGDPFHWFYESFQLDLSQGAHILWAIVWSQGEQAADAQMSVQPGFLLAFEAEQLPLSTGLGNWETCILPGWEPLDPNPGLWRAHRFRISAPFPERNRLDSLPWQSARRVTRARDRLVDWDSYRQRRLHPASLPPMFSNVHTPGKVRAVSAPGTHERQSVQAISLSEGSQVGGPASSLDEWQAFADGLKEIHLPPNTIRRVIFDLPNYLTAYPEMTISGGRGSLVRLAWEESCRAAPDSWNMDKGQRNEIEGKYFTGIADEILPDGSPHARYSPLWWQAGRYLELLIATAEEPLTLHSLSIEETRYPLEMCSDFLSSDSCLNETLPLLVRGLQTNANETFVDSPYYEELQYIGDVQVQSLCNYIMSRDDRLVRKAIRQYDESRQPDGFLQSRYPCHKTQVIAPFSLWWVHTLWDYAHWRNNPAFVRSMLPGMRSTLEAFRRHIQSDGLLHAPEGWNVMDWVPAWDKDAGVPPEGLDGASGLMNWQLVYVLTLASGLEKHFGAPEFAAHYARWADELTQAAQSAFWNESRGLLADDRKHTSFSEHTQVMAILSQKLPMTTQQHIANGLRSSNLERTTYYFTHFLLEAYRLVALDDLIHTQLRRWHTDMVQKGLKTPLERVEPSRSDCHAWASHPLYHYFATVLGIRPAETSFASVEIAPHLGDLEWARGALIHPSGGEIRVELRQTDGRLSGLVELPPGVNGILRLAGESFPISGKWIL